MERSTQNRLTNEFFLVPFSIHRLILKLRGQRTFFLVFWGIFTFYTLVIMLKTLLFVFVIMLKTLLTKRANFMDV